MLHLFCCSYLLSFLAGDGQLLLELGVGGLLFLQCCLEAADFVALAAVGEGGDDFASVDGDDGDDEHDAGGCLDVFVAKVARPGGDEGFALVGFELDVVFVGAFDEEHEGEWENDVHDADDELGGGLLGEAHVGDVAHVLVGHRGRVGEGSVGVEGGFGVEGFGFRGRRGFEVLDWLVLAGEPAGGIVLYHDFFV